MTINWIAWRNRAIAFGVTALIVGAFFAGWILNRPRVEQAQDEGEDEAATVADASGPPQMYTCSMHPTVRSPNPDDLCPICAMALIPVPADADDGDPDAPVLRLSERALRLMEVRTMPVQRRPIEHQVEFVGRLEYDERRVIDVVVRSDSYIERLHANFMWMPLEQGQTIAELYSPAVTAAASEMLVVHRGSAAERNPRALDAARARLNRLGVSDDQVALILDRGEAPRTYEVRSPISGVLKEMGGHEGHWLAEGEHLAEIVDLSTLWLQMEAYETDLMWLADGQPARFTVQTYPGEVFEGTVAFINPIVNERTRTARVRFDVPNLDGLLKPGMFARGAIRASVRGDGRPLQLATAAPDHNDHHAHAAPVEHPLVIPASAPLITGRRAVVYVRLTEEERPTFEGRQIVLGPRVGDFYVVREGLSEGELVVSHGNFKIDSELQIRGRPSMMAPEGGSPPAHHDHGEHAAEAAPDPAPSPQPHQAHAPPPIETPDVPDSFVEALTPVYEKYIALQVALAADDLDASRAAAPRLHEAVQRVDASALDDEQRDLWRVVAARLRSGHAQAAQWDMDRLRVEFQTWSNGAIQAVRLYGYATADDLLIAHCPMAFDDTGADWIQIGDRIDNPYFGALMRRCGWVEERLSRRPGE